LIVAGVVIIVTHRTPSGASRGTGASTNQQSGTTTTAPPVTAIGTYAVTSTSLTVTVAGLPSTDDELPTTVWYPVATSSSVTDGARRDYPLLVFSQGYGQAVANYATLIEDWASAGFVVAGPTYPHTAPSTPTTLDRGDLVHHPDDLRAVISAVVRAGRAPGTVLSGKIDGSDIGVVGQSDGGDVSLAVADNSAWRISGLRAAAILSGAEYPPFGGQYFAPGTPPGPPLLVVQGDADTINPPVCSAQLYNAAPPPKYYLDLLGATHLAPYVQPSSWQGVVATVTTEFFDAELAGERAALGRMATSGNVPGVAALSTGPTAPPASGTCGLTA
jgi:dienelactone hydrolase